MTFLEKFAGTLVAYKFHKRTCIRREIINSSDCRIALSYYKQCVLSIRNTVKFEVAFSFIQEHFWRVD